MLEKRRDLDKFFYLFEQATNIPLDSKKLTQAQDYLCKSGHALCHGPLDYSITDKVTLQLFIDAIESPQLSPCDENFAVFVENVFVPTGITPENEDSLLACLALLSSDTNAWGVVPANAPRPF